MANNGDLSVLIFDNISTKTGNVAPERTIAGSLTTLISPTDVSLDKGRNLLYVADDIDIHVFASASTATGNIAPARNLSLGFAVSAIFVDGTNDRLYAADQAGNAIAVFDNASTLNGPVSANRTIQGAATHLATPGGLQMDGLGRLVVSNASPAEHYHLYQRCYCQREYCACRRRSSEAIRGCQFLTRSWSTQQAQEASYNADPGAARVAVFANLNTATGNIAPTRSIIGASTGLTVGGQPVGVALDTTR